MRRRIPLSSSVGMAVAGFNMAVRPRRSDQPSLHRDGYWTWNAPKAGKLDPTPALFTTFEKAYSNCW